MPTQTLFWCSWGSDRTDNSSWTSGPTYNEIFDQLVENPAPHRKKGRVGKEQMNGADPNPFFGASGVTTELTIVLGPLAQPTLRSLISWLKIAHRTEKKVRVGTERPTGADPNPKVGAVPGLGVFFAYSRSPIRPASRTAIGFAVTPTAPLLHRKLDRVGIT